MKMVLVSTHKAEDERTRGVWLDFQPQMNREIRRVEEEVGTEVFTISALRSYSGIRYDSLNTVRELSDISLTGWWISRPAAFYLEQREVA